MRRAARCSTPSPDCPSTTRPDGGGDPRQARGGHRRGDQGGTLVELGSGTSEKTRLLLDALRLTGRLRRFVPFDVDESVLGQAGTAISAEYPEMAVHAVVGDFERHLGLVPAGGRRLVALLGGTIGNLMPAARAEFLGELRSHLDPGDALLLGADLVKDTKRLVAAYDDRAGVTAAFNRNVLSRESTRSWPAPSTRARSSTWPPGTPVNE